MDLTTRSFDLACALIDFSNACSMTDVSLRIVKWLARERIEDASFTACCKLAASLAYPNAEGMEIRTKLQEADHKIMGVKGAPISLIVSGSLGRLLGYDPESCYMVSSVASLTECYEPNHVTEILCSMILDKGGHQEEVSYQYNIQRALIKAVISKIVESIYINVVNSGHSIGGLCEELNHLHPHLLTSVTFAGIVMDIQRTDKDILIVSDRFPADFDCLASMPLRRRPSYYSGDENSPQKTARNKPTVRTFHNNSLMNILAFQVSRCVTGASIRSCSLCTSRTCLTTPKLALMRHF